MAAPTGNAADPGPVTPTGDAECDSMTNLNAVRARFAHNHGLPFADVLTEASILDVLHEHGVEDRVFGPVPTIWGFLSQVLSDDHSCRDAVARVIAHRAASGLAVCSPNTASYCNARGRLCTGGLRALARRTTQQLPASAAQGWRWNGRSVFIADGSHVSMPDTPRNVDDADFDLFRSTLRKHRGGRWVPGFLRLRRRRGR